MIPAAYLSVIEGYNIQIGDGNLKVTVVDHPSVSTQQFSEFKSSLKRRIVGVRFRGYCRCPYEKDGFGDWGYAWVLLCTATHCLMIDLVRLAGSRILEWLRAFLVDETICFVAPDSDTIGRLSRTVMRVESTINFKTGMTIGFLAARVLKEPEIIKLLVDQLGSHVGIDVKPNLQDPEKLVWSDAMCFSTEHMKCAVHDVYYAFVIAAKLLIEPKPSVFVVPGPPSLKKEKC